MGPSGHRRNGLDRRRETAFSQGAHGRGLAHLCRIGAALGLLAGAALGETQVRGWQSYFGDHRLTKHWGFHFDGQLRSSWEDGWSQLLLRPGVNYYVRPDLFLSLGHAYIRSTPDGGRPAAEQRLWQQVQWMPKVRGVTTVHRFRQEQRWVPGLRVQDRFRYFFRTELPLRSRTYFWSLQNEIFVKGGRSEHRRFYDQNRAYTAIGKRFWGERGSWGRVEAGYMYQHLLRRDGRVQEHNHILVVSFLSSFSRTVR